MKAFIATVLGVVGLILIDMIYPEANVKPIVENIQPIVENIQPIVDNVQPIVENVSSKGDICRAYLIGGIVIFIIIDFVCNTMHVSPIIENIPSIINSVPIIVENAPLTADNISLVKNWQSILESVLSTVENVPPIVENVPPIVENVPPIVENVLQIHLEEFVHFMRNDIEIIRSSGNIVGDIIFEEGIITVVHNNSVYQGNFFEFMTAYELYIDYKVGAIKDLGPDNVLSFLNFLKAGYVGVPGTIV